MTPTLTIRKAAPGDQKALGSLWLAFLQEQAALDARVEVSDDALDRWHNDFPAWIDRDRRHILVAVADDAVVGFAAASRTAPAPIFSYVREVFLEELYVTPDARRRSIGSSLYREMQAWATAWGAQRLRLSVLAANEAARAFWRSLGLSDLSVTMAVNLESEEPLPRQEKGRIGFGV